MPHDTIYGVTATPGYGLDAPSRRKPTVRPDPCGDPCPPRCPACGGLECLCRPRFFPGQLLTDDDLNRFIKYVVDKNKLHNRYLHGWGVACGLEVTCDPCDPNQVIVRTGYALAPCGDDIVVCNDQAVNICELIDQCRPRTQTVCDPPYEREPTDCRGGNNRWVLAICYDERPSRGVTALLGAADSNCKQPCQCGGSAGCASCGGSGCGCGGSCGCGGGSKTSHGAGPGSCATSKGAYNSKPRKVRQPNCEPTQICEGYRFIAYPAPKPVTPTPLPSGDSTNSRSMLERMLAWMFVNRAQLGPLLERMLCCVARAQDLLSALGKGQRVTGAAALDAYAQYAEAMYAFASEFTVHRCGFVGTIGRLYDSSLDFRRNVIAGQQLSNEQIGYIKGQLAQFDNALLEIVSECFCAALLPPCPEPVTSNCVPLAVVTLRANDCRVLDICNWESRKILITWRTVGYWLSWIPWHCLRDLIAKFCCGDRRGSPVLQWLALILGIAVKGAFCGRTRGQKYPYANISGLTANADMIISENLMNMAGGAGGTTITGGGAMGGGGTTGGAGANATVHPPGDVAAALASDDLLLHLLEDFDRGQSGEAPAPAWFKLAARFVDGSLLDDVASVGGKGGLDEMRQELVKLQEVVAKQQAQINTLHKG